MLLRTVFRNARTRHIIQIPHQPATTCTSNAPNCTSISADACGDAELQKFSYHCMPRWPAAPPDQGAGSQVHQTVPFIVVSNQVLKQLTAYRLSGEVPVTGVSKVKCTVICYRH